MHPTALLRAAAVACVMAATPALASPELTADVTWEATPSEGGLYTVVLTATVRNDGDQDASTVCVDLFWDLVGPPTPTSTSIAEAFIPSLPAKASEVVQLTVLYVDTEPHVGTVFVDSCGIVKEGNEADNLVIVPVSIAPPGADIVLEKLSVKVYDDVALYEVRVRNAGTVQSDTFVVDLFVDRDSPPEVGDEGQQFVWIAPLGPGVTAVVDLPPIALTAGTYTSWALADSLDFVAEPDEANNVFGPLTVEVGTVEELQPDVYLGGLDVTTMGTAVTFTMDVRNVGQSPCPPTKAVVVLDSDTPPTPLTFTAYDYREALVPPLGAGEAETVLIGWEDAPTGTHHAWVLLDVGDAADELNEQNNVIGPITVYVQLPGPAPDLQVTAFEALVFGADVKYTVQITNGGTASTGPFDVDVFYDSEYKPNVLIGQIPEGDYVQEPVGLAPGAAAVYELTWAAADVGQWRSWAVVDALNLIGESDEKNNAAGPLDVVVVPVTGPDVEILTFAAKVTGNDVLYLATVRNAGDVPAGPFDADVIYDLPLQPPIGERGDAFRTVELLLPGEETSVSFALNGAPGGTYKSWLVIDTLKQVQETSEANNIAGPRDFTIDPDALACAQGPFLKDVCICGGQTVSSGYCCGGAWSALPCLDAPDAGGEAGEDVAPWSPGGPVKEAGRTWETTGGCGAAPGPASLAPLLALLLWRRPRR